MTKQVSAPHVNVDAQGRFFLDNGTTPTKEQAERIAHSANAYPRLVGALRTALYGADWDGPGSALASLNSTARALLLDLGELP